MTFDSICDMIDLQIKKEVDKMYMLIDRNENEPLLMSAEEVIDMAREFEYFNDRHERVIVRTIEDAFEALKKYKIYRMGDNNE